MDLIIPVFNNPSYTQACLDSLLTVQHGVPIRPIIVDNGSRVKTKSIIDEWVVRAKSLEPKVVSLPRNAGFAGAVNAGLREANTDEDVCIMHNDVVPFDGWLASMRQGFAMPDRDVAIVMPRTSYANESTPIFPPSHDAFTKLKPCNKNHISVAEISKLVEASTPIDLQAALAEYYPVAFSHSTEVCSFCMLVKGGIFEEFGVFDEEFFPRGYEDIYWFISLAMEGLCCVVANRAYVHHFGNITSDGPGFELPEVMRINKERFERKKAARNAILYDQNVRRDGGVDEYQGQEGIQPIL